MNSTDLYRAYLEVWQTVATKRPNDPYRVLVVEYCLSRLNVLYENLGEEQKSKMCLLVKELLLANVYSDGGDSGSNILEDRFSQFREFVNRKPSDWSKAIRGLAKCKSVAKLDIDLQLANFSEEQKDERRRAFPWEEGLQQLLNWLAMRNGPQANVTFEYKGTFANNELVFIISLEGGEDGTQQVNAMLRGLKFSFPEPDPCNKLSAEVVWIQDTLFLKYHMKPSFYDDDQRYLRYDLPWAESLTQFPARVISIVPQNGEVSGAFTVECWNRSPYLDVDVQAICLTKSGYILSPVCTVRFHRPE